MKIGAVLICSVLVFGVVTFAMMREGEKVNDPSVASLADVERLTLEVRSLKERQTQLEERLASVEARPIFQPTSVVEPTAADERSESGAVAMEEAASNEVDLDEQLEVILDPETLHDEQQQAWRRLARAGLLDEAVSNLEEYAAAHPDDPDAQSDLGHAYIQKVLAVNDLEKGVWAMKAHASYDRALELDDHHWEARFSKAVSYAFAPPAFGLQSKAVEHFEILRSQQEVREPQGHFAYTYSMLGNVYQGMGEQEKAREVWRTGAELFPDRRELQEKAGLAGE